MMKLLTRRAVLLATILLTTNVYAQDLAQETETFQRVFHQPRVIPEDEVKKALELHKGDRLEYDRNGDGKIDELLYVDTAKRHTLNQTLLVKVVDEDGDMDSDGWGDHDSDLYLWDWGADGVIDVVTDYQDDDGDNDVDQMGIFYEDRSNDSRDDITVLWAVDIGDDNLLLYDVNGMWSQPDCQWRSHFSGDELVYQFNLSVEDMAWGNVLEAPFAFYDMDGDTCSEIALSITSLDEDVKSFRYSMDADNDAFGDRTHNYDFSVTAFAPEKGLFSNPKSQERLIIRGIITLPAFPWSQAIKLGQNAHWNEAVLTWDEINSNTDANPDHDPHERWEGVLNPVAKNGDYIQEGHPPSSSLNKRVEVAKDHVSPIQLYFEGKDHRFHLQDADYGYLDIDYNFDGVPDAFHTWRDTLDKGQFDIHTVDVDGMGMVDITQELSSGSKRYYLDYESVSPKYIASIEEVLADSQAFIDSAIVLLGHVPDDVQEVIDFYAGPLLDYHPETELGSQIQNSPEGARLYVELVRDRLYVHVINTIDPGPNWKKLRKAYRAGNYTDAERTLTKISGQKRASKNRPFTYRGKTYTQYVTVELDGQESPVRGLENQPQVIAVHELKKKHPDFNPRNCVVVDGDYWLAWRPVAHQLDTFNFDGLETISFLSNLNGVDTKTYRIYYLPDGVKTPEYTKLTHAVSEGSREVAWESDAGAYRFYTGQFDFFGKHVSRTIPREERLLYPIRDDVRKEQDWGMDALHVGSTSGLGGLTLHVGTEAYPVMNPAGEGDVQFEYRVLGTGPVRSAVEMVATHVLPDAPEKAVTIRAFMYAGHPESEIHVRLPEGLKRPQLAIGLVVLHGDYFGSARSGYLGAWGMQTPEIGDIGLAVIAPASQANGIIDLPDTGERQLVCNVNDSYGKPKGDTGEHLRYWILGEWQRGMQYPISQSSGNWERRVSEMAKAKELGYREGAR